MLIAMPKKKPTVTPFHTNLAPYSAEWVKALRVHRGLNQTQAAKLCGIKQPSWSQWESGITSPDNCCRKLLELIAKAVI